MSEKALQIAKEEIARVIRNNNQCLTDVEISELAGQVLQMIDWNSPALMHKGIAWIADFYMNRLVNA